MQNNNILFFNSKPIINDLSGIQKVINDYLLSKQIENHEVNIIFVDIDEITRLNREYRGKNIETDVITFSMMEGKETEFSGNMLGDIYICNECIANQSYRETIRRVFHGIIHLSGDDHEGSDEEYEGFLAIENNLMTQFFGV